MSVYSFLNMPSSSLIQHNDSSMKTICQSNAERRLILNNPFNKVKSNTDDIKNQIAHNQQSMQSTQTSTSNNTFEDSVNKEAFESSNAFEKQQESSILKSSNDLTTTQINSKNDFSSPSFPSEQPLNHYKADINKVKMPTDEYKNPFNDLKTQIHIQINNSIDCSFKQNGEIDNSIIKIAL